MWSWLANFLGLVIFWELMDLESKSIFYGVVCPILFALFLILLMTKVFFLIGRGGRGDGGGFWGDGDGGGGGDGGC